MQQIQFNLQLALGMLILTTLSFTLALNGQNMYKSNELLISFKETTQNGGYSISAESTGCSKIKTLNELGTEVWCIPDTLTFAGDTVIGIENIADYFESFVGVVKYAEPNYEVTLCGVPNDSYYSELWGMNKISMPEAWDTQEGDSDIIVGVLDSGIDWSHEDLKENIWQNLAEDADEDGSVLEWTGSEWILDPDDENEIDDDGNGYVDDLIGWDFYNDKNKPIDNCGHGTHVAGTVGALGNNDIGVIGVSPNIKLMSLKAFEVTPFNECLGSSTFVSEIVEALNYATKMGATISTNSYGGFGYSQTFKDAIDLAGEQDHLFVAAAGNDNANSDLIPLYPAAYNSPNIISVAATDENDNLAVFGFPYASNYGATSVDLAAPGSLILSTTPGNNYEYYFGTSMAVPHVVGAAALIKAQCPQLDNQDIKNAILESVDVIIPALEGKCMSGGRLNVSNALKSIPSECEDPKPEPPVSNCSREADSTALVALYEATDGDNWENSWDFDQPMSTWYGVILNDEDCVIELDLSINNLVGVIPNEIGDLSNLMELRLQNNYLTGNIPISLENLTNLQDLFLNVNQLSGEIPTNLFNNSNLSQLRISENQLTGNIPDVSNLTSCVHLDLGSNLLTGWIPKEFSLLPNLTYLYLGNNSLSGTIPPELGDISKLEALRLDGNMLTGSIPAELGYSSSLTFLTLKNNQLSGCYSESLCSINDVNFTNNPDLPDGGSQQGFEDFCAGIAPPCNPGCAQSDSLALVAFYNATNGAEWDDNIKWDLNQPMSGWHGVTVNNDGCVASIGLHGKNLTGSIPPELGDISNLNILDLSTNNLSGEIPAELGYLSSLQFLSLNENKLNGNIPSELGYLSNLNTLYLFKNNLEGNIPNSFGNLVNINDIRLHNNLLTGSIPTEIGNWINCTVLSLAGNSLTGNIPNEIGSMSSLTTIYLNKNMLAGNIPVEISNLENLSVLDLSGNQLDGYIPIELGELSNLTFIWLNNNQLSGFIPNEIGNLTSLKSLYLSSNQLIGEIPATLGGLTNLIDLRLGINLLTGEIPPELGNLTNLDYLVLENNQLSGCYPESLCGLDSTQMIFINNPGLPDGGSQQGFEEFCADPAVPCDTNCSKSDSLALVALYNATGGNSTWSNITWDLSQPISTWQGVITNNDGCVTELSLPNNNLKGWIPDEIGLLSNLINLDLTDNSLGGVIPTTIGNLSNLESLKLSSNELEGEIPTSLGNLYNLTFLDLAFNQLTGSIPPELGLLQNLTLLYLFNNHLTNSIPAELGALNNLYVLQLNDNLLTGSIPPEIGNLSSLTWLDLTTNFLTGKIPPQLGLLENLVGLKLFNNNLSGSIPTEIGNMANLEYLTLYHNELTGGLPVELSNLTNLIELNISFNELSGEIPVEYGALTSLEMMFLYENNLTGSIPVELGQLSNLTDLVLGLNQLTGSIPTEFGNLTNLKQLNLDLNQLTGEIPTELGNLTNLEYYLGLGENQLTGEIPASLGNLINLKSLNLQRNQLSGGIPDELGNLINLTEIYLNENLLVDKCYPGPWCDLDPLFYNFYLNIGLPDNGSHEGFENYCIDPASFNCEPSNCLTLDSLILVDLYNSTDGANWDTIWNLDMPVSTWYGVELDNEGCNVARLVLNENNLVGMIPASIGNLSELGDLHLKNNELEGFLPIEIGNLSNLGQLHLGDNFLEGNIPPEIGNLTKIHNLSIGGNNFSGNIPTEIGNLTNLVYLFLSNNQLNGSIPAEIGNLTNLVDLRLSENNLTGNIPASLGNLINVFSLTLQKNNLTGNIPSELGDMLSLTGLSLQENNLSGEIPEELGNLSNLTYLRLDNNNLSGCYPKSLCNLNLTDYDFSDNPELQDGGSNQWYEDFCADLVSCTIEECDAVSDSLALIAFYNATGGDNWSKSWDLSTPYRTWYGVYTNDNGCITKIGLENNNLTGFIPDELSTLNKLTELHLENNNLSGNMPISLSNCTNLEILHLQKNQLSGEIPNEYGAFVKIRELDLSHNSLTGQIPFDLGSLTNLNELILSFNPFDSDIPPSFGGLTNLRILNLENCQLIGEIPSVLGNATSLEILRLNNNQLTGIINSSFGQCVNLRELHLENNFLTGFLIIELGNLSNLEILHLDNNELMGEIPDSYGNLYNLIDIDLHNNNLNQAIPASLGNLTSLQKMNLSINNFTGTIPTEFGNLANLTLLHLSNNQLTGEIPEQLGNLNNLTYLNLSDNQLAGCYPISLCGLNLEYYNFKYNIYLHDGGSDQGFLDICDGKPCDSLPIDCEPFTIDLGPDQDAGCTPIILSINFPDAAYIIWDYEGTTDSTYLNVTSIEATLPGTYGVAVADSCGNVAVDSIEVFGGGSCVWPGDMDYNQIANYLDVLYWGMDYKKTGPPRANASTDWVPQAATDWDYTGPGNVNDKHSDANGDGIVDTLDLDVLFLNYGKTHTTTLNTMASSASIFTQVDTELTSFENEEITIDVIIDENNDGIHGMAWQVDLTNYSNLNIPINAEEYMEFKIAGARFEYEDGWFGQENTDVLSFDNFYSIMQGDELRYKLDISVTRIDGQNINSNGLLGKIIVDIDHVGTWAKVEGGPPIQNSISPIRIGNAQYINNQSEMFAINTGTSTAAFGGSIGIDPIDLKAGWNLISFDVVPFSKKIEDVFANLKPNNLEYVIGYNNGASAYTHNGDTVFNTLKEIEKGYGYWVKVKEDDSMYAYGLHPEEIYPKLINAGWNLTSFHSLYDYSPTIYFNDIIAKDNLAFVSGYDGQELIFNPNNPANSTLNTLKNGMGYWVKLKKAEEGGSTENVLLSNVFDFVNGTCNLSEDEEIIIQNQDKSSFAMAKVMADGKITTTPIYGDDLFSTDMVEGMLKGDSLIFTWKGQMLNVDINFNGDRTIHSVNLEFEDVDTGLEGSILEGSILEENLAVLAYPNPVVDVITFDINLLRPNEKLIINIFNDNGQLIRVITEKDLKVGLNTFTYNFKELPVGRYIYQINGNWSKRTDSFIKLK